MERCPNCGATVREGARFCTACGFRMIAAHDAPPEESGSGSDPAQWWGPTAADANSAGELAESPSPVGDVERRPSGGSFWERIEDATQDQAPGEPSPNWSRPVTATPISEVAAEEEQRSEPAEDDSSTVILTSTDAAEEGDAAPTDRATDEELAESDPDQERDPAESAVPSIPFEPGGNSLMSELGQVAQLLAEARPAPGPAITSQMDELREAIEDARERPREIDAMLAISARLEVIDNVIAANERMETAILQALIALRGEHPG